MNKTIIISSAVGGAIITTLSPCVNVAQASDIQHSAEMIESSIKEAMRSTRGGAALRLLGGVQAGSTAYDFGAGSESGGSSGTGGASSGGNGGGTGGGQGGHG